MATGREERDRRRKSPAISTVHHECWLDYRKPAEEVNFAEEVNLHAHGERLAQGC